MNRNSSSSSSFSPTWSPTGGTFRDHLSMLTDLITQTGGGGGGAGGGGVGGGGGGG